ncbi:MAG: hypothetical protein A2784_01215 [Candidatus Chisholmbacteria bacterium RIFCSPHIGHO2_01_FULL_48_12]|uniref:Ribbon-helix-helix protein CopG domain-containing protein n=1 Tax=Candidatus Chisholmbacteria bacterium RIFCSPHIGHO2_01_FULL_48_12 TaxID=1797589 RepID=A0A1G1VR69_9BACT|nr:MAG: hypothetical protein A2784_01215 [Candidatus Chisholmbacteria bacterium RIFCSPHIGHO2_01_FULL_48_12]
MTIQQIVQDTSYSVRTQISLSPSLHRAVKQRGKRWGKSLSQLVREALIRELQMEEKRRVGQRDRLEWLIQATRGTIKLGDRGWGAVKDPSRLIRRWRADEERHWS